MTTLVGALLIGVTLGLLGSGGSAITVPILVYLVGHDAKIAIAESMAIVGLISLAGAIPKSIANQVDWRSVFWFGIPAMMGTWLGAWLGGMASDALQLTVFGAVAILAAAFMLKKAYGKSDEKVDNETVARTSPNPVGIAKIVFEGVIVGALTGFVGVGGGFLIVPALLMLGKLPIRVAIGTSLVIIAMKSAIGFAKYHFILEEQGLSVDYQTILMFSLIGIAGCAIGQMLNSKLNQATLKKVFAIFLVLIGGYVIFHEGGKMMDQSETVPTVSHVTPLTSLSDVQQQQRKRAIEAKDRMFASLLAALMDSMSSSGPAKSIRVCKTKAPEIAKQVGEETGVRIGRTSFRLRNQSNVAPDWAASFVKDKVEKPVNVALPDEKLGVLLPIRLKETCTLCHGNDQQVMPDVKAAILSNYPNDDATGFSEGDVRGYFWIEVPPTNQLISSDDPLE